jgi:hypothetical protein
MSDATPNRVQCVVCGGTGQIKNMLVGDLGTVEVSVSCATCGGTGRMLDPMDDDRFDIETIEGYILRAVVPLYEGKDDHLAYIWYGDRLYCVQQEDKVKAIMQMANAAITFDAMMLSRPNPSSVPAIAALSAFREAVRQYKASFGAERSGGQG